MIDAGTWDVVAFDEHDAERIRLARANSMAYAIMKAHNRAEDMEQLKLQVDAIVSPDNNYTNILQTAKACGIQKFPIPYVLSNCHHTLSAVGGTVNEDDHVFGMSNVKKYGGIFVPKYTAVIHQYMREMMAGCGKLIMASDSHARYGALGTMGIGEGGGEVAKQLLGRTYDLKRPDIIAVRLDGTPAPGVGPMDVALTLIAATFGNDFNKNRVLEFIGSGISNLSMEFRMGIDVMTTESAALSSIWCTDELTRDYLRDHGREQDYQKMTPQGQVYYDRMIEIDLGRVEPMIALPFHPSNALPIRELKANPENYLREVETEGCKIKKSDDFHIMDHIRDGRLYVDQALIGGCAGGMFENIVAVADILKGYGIRSDQLGLGVNPSSLPVMSDLMDIGIGSELAKAGVKAWQIFDSKWPEQIIHMPDGHGYTTYFVPDDKIAEYETVLSGFGLGYTTQAMVDEAADVKCDTLEELAEKTGLPYDTMKAEIERYNELCHNGLDEDFGKMSKRMFPVENPPYYACKFGNAGMLVMFGGLECNHDLQVTKDGTNDPIPGLYVAGNTMGRRLQVDYPVVVAGISLATALSFGRLAGKNAAAAV